MRFALVLLVGALALVPAVSEAGPKKDARSRQDKAKAADDALDLDLSPPGPAEDDLELSPLEPVKKDPKGAEKKPDGTPGEVISAVAVPTPQEPPGPAPQAPSEPLESRVRVTPAAGLGYTSEAAFGAATPLFGAGLRTEVSFTREASLALALQSQLYRRRYLTTRPALDGGPGFVELDEQKLSADLLFAYELLPLLGVKDRRPSLAVQVGPALRFFHNDALRSQAGGVAVGGRLGFALSEQLDLAVGGTWAYNLLFANEGHLSAYGSPKAFSSLEGSVGLRLAPKTRVRLGYGGEIVTQAASYRLFHALSFSFEVSL